MKAAKHFCTITKHKILVMKECFRVGLYRQGILHDLSKYSWTEFADIIKEIEVRTMLREKTGAILLHGFIIKEETNIIMNTGWITVWTEPEEW